MRLLDKFKSVTEAEVGSGTSIKDTQNQQKRAKLNLQAAELRLKQEKERIALQKKKSAVKVKEEADMTESFSASQIAALKAEYSKINTIDPSGDAYKKLIAMLDKLDAKSLETLANAGVKFVSKLAQNRVARRKPTNEGRSIKEYMSDKGGRYVHKGTYGSEKSAAAGYSGHDDDNKPEIHPKDKAPAKKGANQNRRVDTKLYKKEDVRIAELSNEKLGDYKKKAGEAATAADKAGDTKTGNKRFSGIMKATRKQFGNDAKQKTEELSPKQKELDKNKNGKIDGSDLAKLRGEELSAKQKALDKNNNGKIDGSDLAQLRSKKKQPQGADFAAQRRKERMASTGRMDEAKSDYEIYHKDYSSAVQTAIKQAEKRGFEVDMDDWHDKVATGPKKPSSGKTNSFSINLMKDGKPSKKKLQMQVYNMDNQKYELNMYIESVEEASSPAQQAAIAIAMKKAGKKPKDMEESDAYDKNVKPSNKPHDKEAAAKRAKIAALFARKKMIKNESKDNKETTANDKKKSIKQGDKLSGKQEPVTINPELNQVK